MDVSKGFNNPIYRETSIFYIEGSLFSGFETDIVQEKKREVVNTINIIFHVDIGLVYFSANIDIIVPNLICYSIGT